MMISGTLTLRETVIKPIRIHDDLAILFGDTTFKGDIDADLPSTLSAQQRAHDGTLLLPKGMSGDVI